MIRKSKRIFKALKRRIGMGIDYLIYARRAKPYIRLLDSAGQTKGQPALLIVSGLGMNVVWAQIWSIMSLPIRLRGYRCLVLSMRSQWLLNAYYHLFSMERIYLDDYLTPPVLPVAMQASIDQAKSIEQYRVIFYKNAPVGQIALSTYSRNIGTGLIDFSDPKVRRYIADWIGRICVGMDNAEKLFALHRVKMLFFTEVFMEDYGAFYYAALNAHLNIVRFAGTVRDDAFIMQHLSKANDRIHHASLDRTTWESIKNSGDDVRIEAELMQNFQDRYGEKWHRSKRNHPGTRIMDIEKARSSLGIAPGRKVAVIYSHILYDTLFFFGTDLFKDYAEWLVETTRAAIANPHVDWLIKVHPSNLWRGEMDTLLKGRYEEERLLQREFGTLPAHVRIIGADTKINPLTWFGLADYGITVRGTSGLEMAALGKTVVTAGTGRYEGSGFTTDPATAADYLETLKRLHELPPLTPQQTRWAKRYAHAIFVLKPYTLHSLVPRLRTGCKVVSASDDIIYIPAKPANEAQPIGDDLEHFARWALTPENRDLLSAG